MSRTTTTTRKRSTTTARKTTTTARTAPAAPAPAEDSAAVVANAQASADETGAASDAAEQTPNAGSADELRKADLIDQVVAASGIKKKYAKPVVEAALAALGNALSEGRTMNLQPLGKVMVTDKRNKENGVVLITRIRRSQQSAEQAAEEVKTPLAEPGEES